MENHTLKHMNAYFEARAEKEKFKYCKNLAAHAHGRAWEKHLAVLAKDPHHQADMYKYWLAIKEKDGFEHPSLKEYKESELAGVLAWS